MKSRSESLIRLKKFQVDEKRRQVAQIQSMIADFERMAAELDQQIEVEHGRELAAEAKVEQSEYDEMGRLRHMRS